MGNSAHADDVRASSISVTAAQTQGNLINAFCKANSLKLNASKTELIRFTKGKKNGCIHDQADVKCLGSGGLKPHEIS